MNPHEDHQAEQGARAAGLLRRIPIPRIVAPPDGICGRCNGWWIDCGGCEVPEDDWDGVEEDRETGRIPRSRTGAFIPSGH